MSDNDKLHILVNLPPTFFTHPMLKAHFKRLSGLGTVRKTSSNTLPEMVRDAVWADVILMWAWPAFTDEFLADKRRLRFLGAINTTQTTVKACFRKGVAVSEARHCWSPAVAEMALTLILAGLRKTSAYHAAFRTGAEAWVNDFPADIDPLERELAGLPVGIVGFGGIGQRLAELLQPFHNPIRIYDPFLPAEVAHKFGVQPTPLLELIRASDVVVLCAANTENARNLLGRREIAALRKNAVLVNVGRSLLVDMAALQARLEKGDLIAMLDVFDREPLEKDSPLRALPNAFLTPHRAGGVMTSVQRALTMLTDDLEAFLAGKERRCAFTERMLNSIPE